MSRHASKSLIGAFVLGAIALAVASVVIFGSGTFFRKVDRNVMFFEGSVAGLQIGAPVVFRGVQIGRVTDVILEVDVRDLKAFIPVYTEIDKKRIVPILPTGGIRDEHFLQALIDKGLRAQVQLQSLVTNQLMVSLDFHPDTPVRLVGLEKRYPEIPTIPSDLERLRTKLEEIPLKEIADKLNQTLAGINRLVASPELQASIGTLNHLLNDTDVLVQNFRTQIGPLATEMKETTIAARAAFMQAEKTLRFDQGEPGEIASGIKETLFAAQKTLRETNRAVETINGIVAQNVNLGYEISRTLEQIADLTRSVRVLADYLERHPEALLRGKRSAEGE
ncbi:MAG TPA: MlaD family protein [Syntrophorhabdales bacterium]|nr:MlaD family protein [Syntrophorhabdales bacterium]